MIRSAAETVMHRCEILGGISEEADRLTRPFASPAMHEAGTRVEEWMREAGMTVRRDYVGNLRGRYAGARENGATLILGSHIDTVRDAGKYDGPLGVMVAIAVVQRLHDSGTRLPFTIDVIAFADEEGLRFGTTYLGSRALAGTLDAEDMQRVDAEGVSMAEAIRGFGGDPGRLAEDRWHGGDLLGYCEVHIEQGPVLEAGGLPVGVVSTIAGQSRFTITFTGEAGHAGTVPMAGRKDALAAAAELVLAIENEARSQGGLVATVGQLTIGPGAANVIPGRVTLSLDVRHPDDDVRIAAAQRMLATAQEIAGRRAIRLETHQVSDNESTPCSPRLAGLLARAIEELGLPVANLASGAGHDAVTMAGLTDVAMVFVRCKGGISHNPAESVEAADIGVAIDVLYRFLELLAKA